MNYQTWIIGFLHGLFSHTNDPSYAPLNDDVKACMAAYSDMLSFNDEMFPLGFDPANYFHLNPSTDA